MRFYDKEQEIAFLKDTREQARRVARKAEGDLCEAYIEEVNEKLGIPTLD